MDDRPLALAKGPEHVVVAGGGVVAGDDRHCIGACDPARRDVEAAAHALAIASAEARAAAVGMVVFDRVALEGESRVRVLVDAASQAVAATAPVAGDSEVVGHRTVADGERRSEEIGEAAAPGVAAVAAGSALAADGDIVVERAV